MTLVQNIQTDDQSQSPTIPRLLETSNFAIPSHSLRRFSVTLDLVVMSFISFRAEESANAPKLEPALEGLLLSANVKQQIIYAFRVQVQEITSINSGSTQNQKILPTRRNGQSSTWCGSKRGSHATPKTVWTP